MPGIFIFVCFIWTTGLPAQLSQHPYTARWTLAVSGGYGQERFGWSIAGNADGTGPNVLSELQWKRLSGVNANICVRYDIGSRFFLAVSGHVLCITGGEVTDVDYGANNRTQPTYNAHFQSKGGHTDNSSIALGYVFYKRNRLQLDGSLGGELRHRVLDMGTSLDERLYPTGGVHSSYRSRSGGITGCLQAAYLLTGKLNLKLDAGYSMFSFNGQGNWNLNPNLEHPKSFEQTAMEKAFNFNLALVYELPQNNACFMRTAVMKSNSSGGDDALHPRDGSVVLTRFNGASGNAVSVCVGWQKRL